MVLDENAVVIGDVVCDMYGVSKGPIKVHRGQVDGGVHQIPVVWFHAPCTDTVVWSSLVNEFKFPSEPVRLDPDILTDSNRRSIKKQKAIGADLLRQLRILDSAAIIAGGAPRDWSFNRVAHDLDFFLEVPKRQSQNKLKNTLEYFGITGVYNMATHTSNGVKRTIREVGENYEKRMTDIHSVYEGLYQGQRVQVIFLQVSPYGYVETHFDTSINMLWAVPAPKIKGQDSTLSIRFSNEYQATVDIGCIFVYPNQTAYSSDHLKRVASYFPDVPLVNKDYMKEVIKDPKKAMGYSRTWETHLKDVANVNNIYSHESDELF